MNINSFFWQFEGLTGKIGCCYKMSSFVCNEINKFKKNISLGSFYPCEIYIFIFFLIRQRISIKLYDKG